MKLLERENEIRSVLSRYYRDRASAHGTILELDDIYSNVNFLNEMLSVTDSYIVLEVTFANDLLFRFLINEETTKLSPHDISVVATFLKSGNTFIPKAPPSPNCSAVYIPIKLRNENDLSSLSKECSTIFIQYPMVSVVSGPTLATDKLISSEMPESKELSYVGTATRKESPEKMCNVPLNVPSQSSLNISK